MDFKNMIDFEKGQLALNSDTPEDVLRELAKVQVSPFWVRRNIALNFNTPEDTLCDLAKDESSIVRRTVPQNYKSSVKVLITLFEYEKSLKYPSEDVIGALYTNSKLPHIAKVIIETLFGEMLT